jgi:N-acylneuraminate cytidylyltransferase
MNLAEILVVIPARKGSKGIPGKNKKQLNGKPLIAYTLEAALQIFKKEQICISTDDPEIIKIAENYGIHVPFVRPEDLATDAASMQDVLIHACHFFTEKKIAYKYILLLQVTSPFRNANHIKDAIELFGENSQMLVSVVESKANPYFNLMEENENGWLIKSKSGHFATRQSSPKVYELTGAIYIINVGALLSKQISEFVAVQKYVMDKKDSIDIDEEMDWEYAEFIFGKQLK